MKRRSIRTGHKLSTLAVLLLAALRRTGSKSAADLQAFSCCATFDQVRSACAELVNAGAARAEPDSDLYSVVDHDRKLDIKK